MTDGQPELGRGREGGRGVRDFQSYPKGSFAEEGVSIKGSPQSDLICPQDFLQAWDIEALEAVHLKTGPKDEEGSLSQIAKKMKLDQDTVQELSEVCGVANLYCGDEPKSRKDMLLLKETSKINLKCVKHQMEQRKLREQNKNLRVASQRSMRYSYLDEFSFLKSAKESDTVLTQETEIPVPNVIVSVQIQKCLLQGVEWHKAAPSETFNVLGCQTLSALKDVIRCPMDSVIAGDYSSLPDVDKESLPKAGELYKSGFFFIENVFYNDLRHSDNKDYSKPILEWAKTNWRENDLTVADMTTTKFSDLKFRLGQYYLFTHQGNCEHSVQFQDLRLFTSEDCQNLNMYPLRTVERFKARKLCQGCTKLSARWIVFESLLTPTDPCFLCQKCFKSLLYSSDGEKISNFKAYNYSECFT